MTINDQIRDEKLQYDINREAAKISTLSSGKIHKLLPSNQQQIMEQTKFTYSPLGKAFEKQVKTIEDQGKKQVDVLKDLKEKEQTKLIEDKSSNQSNATIIFNYLINKRKKIMSELHDSVDYNNLKFEYVGPTKDVSFYEYMDSKELYNAIKNNQIRFNDVLKRQDGFLNKLSNVKLGKKTLEQKKIIDNINKFYHFKEEVINFFKDSS